MRILICFFLFLIALPVFAQNADRKKPLEVSADESLEWHRNEFFFLARKNVHAVQGGTELYSEILRVDYGHSEEGGLDISLITAQGDVKLVSDQSKIYGDKAFYDVVQGYAVMTGKDLKLVSDDQVVSARDDFKYFVHKGRLEARGQAKAVREGDTLEADRMIALFTQDNKTGKRVLKSLEAIGNVVITTPDEILSGNRAVYSAETNVAELIEGVVIVRGPNKLQGSRAEVNLNTNISKIFGGEQEEGGRVRGVFYPGEVKKPE